MILVLFMKANYLTNFKGKPVYYALVLLESLAIKKSIKRIGVVKVGKQENTLQACFVL